MGRLSYIGRRLIKASSFSLAIVVLNFSDGRPGTLPR